MLRKPLTHKKANTMLFHVLSGLIVGFLFLIFFLKVLIPMIFNAKDYTGSFDDFVEVVSSMSDPSIELAERMSPILLLDEDSALIVFTPNSLQANGRLGDGNIHNIINQNQMILQYHFLRPNTACSSEKTCICLCKDIFVEELTNQIPLSNLKIDRSKLGVYNPYSYSQELEKKYLYDASKQINNNIISCKSISCTQLDVSLYTPLKGDYLSETPDYNMYENGFIISRKKNIVSGDIPAERTTIHVIKLANNQLLIITKLDSLIEVNKLVDFQMKLQKQSATAQKTREILDKYYQQNSMGDYDLLATQNFAQTIKEVQVLYDALDELTKETYFLDETTGKIYINPMPSDFISAQLLKYYVEGPDGVLIRSSPFTTQDETNLMQAAFDAMPVKIQEKYELDLVSGDINLK